MLGLLIWIVLVVILMLLASSGTISILLAAAGIALLFILAAGMVDYIKSKRDDKRLQDRIKIERYKRDIFLAECRRRDDLFVNAIPENQIVKKKKIWGMSEDIICPTTIERLKLQAQTKYKRKPYKL